jgi:predicted phosphohydrolase
MGDIAKILILFGALLIAVGVVLLVVPKLPFLGRLPGDIIIKRGNTTFYFPLATSILISILISLIVYLLSRFR